MNLQDITTEELEAQFATVTDDDTIVALVAEMDRRERLATAKAARADRDRARYEAIRTEWAEMAYADYLNAETATRGNLLNRAGEAAGINPFSLWAGKDSEVAKYASEELANWFLDHPRTTTREYLRQAKAGKRAAREEAEMENVNDTYTSTEDHEDDTAPQAAATRIPAHHARRRSGRTQCGRNTGPARPARHGGSTMNTRTLAALDEQHRQFHAHLKRTADLSRWLGELDDRLNTADRDCAEIREVLAS